VSDLEYKTQNQEEEVQKPRSMKPHPLGLVDENQLPKIVVVAAAAVFPLLYIPLLLLVSNKTNQ
jgi:hypothetical protein